MATAASSSSLPSHVFCYSRQTSHSSSSSSSSSSSFAWLSRQQQELGAAKKSLPYDPFLARKCSYPQTLSVTGTILLSSAANATASVAKVAVSCVRSSALHNGIAVQSRRPLAAAPCSHALTVKILEKKRNVRVQASKESVEVDERIIAALGYLLPFLDGVQYGRFLFIQFPATQALLQPFLPLLGFYKTYPFASVVAFFTLYLVVVRNPNFSRYVRFNTMQAVVLDVLLIIPSLIERTIPADGGIGYDFMVSFYNTVFLYLVACFVFGFSSCLLGKTPRLPLVADAADAQVY